MTVSKNRPLNKIEIWSPKWSTKEVLIAVYKVRGENEIVITRGGSWNGSYYLDAATIQASPQTTNGAIKCYAVPLDKLKPLERSE